MEELTTTHERDGKKSTAALETSAALPELFDGGTSLGPVTDLGNGRWSKVIAGQPPRVYDLHAKAGSVSSNHWSITLKEVSPTIVRVTGGGIDLAENELNEADAIMFHGNAAPGATVVLEDQATRYGTTTASSSGEWSMLVSSLSPGSYVFKASVGTDVSNQWRVQVKAPLYDYTDFENQSWGGWAKGAAGRDMILQWNGDTFNWRLWNVTYGAEQKGTVLYKTHVGLKVGGVYQFEINAAQRITAGKLRAQLELATSSQIVLPGFFPLATWQKFSGAFTANNKVLQFEINSLVDSGDGNDYLIDDILIRRLS